MKGKFGSKSFKIGSYTVLICAVALAIAVAVNFFVGALPASITRIDMTSDSVYTLSDQTMQIIKALDTPVTINHIAQSGNENSVVTELLNRYEEGSSNIMIKRVDPVVSPNFVSEYTKDTLIDNSVIVVSDKRYQVVSFRDMGTTTSFTGESAITSAIDFVTKDDLPKVYNLTGHGEKSLTYDMSTSIARENVEVIDFNLMLTNGVPDDAACLLVIAPANDISADEKQYMLDYLDDGGRMLLLTNYTATPQPNLQELLADYGVRGETGIIIEGDESMRLAAYQHYLLPKMNYHDITNPLRDNGYHIFLPSAQGIVQTGDVRKTVNITPLASTSDKAYSKIKGYDLKTYEYEDGDIMGPFDVAVAINEKFSDKETKIVWISTALLLESEIDSFVYGSNTDFFLNSLGWMCETQNSVTVRAKSISSGYIAVPSTHARRWSILLIGVIPIAFILTGAVIWYRRRRR